MCNASPQMHYDVMRLLFQHLDGRDLFEASVVCRQWHRWVLRYAPGRLLESYPQDYRASMTREIALQCLVSHSIASRNMPNGLFRHKIFDFPRGSGALGISRHRLQLFDNFPTNRERGLFVASSRTGQIETFLVRTTLGTGFATGLMWHQVENSLQAWDHVSGTLKHTIKVNETIVIRKVAGLGLGRVEVLTETDHGTRLAISDCQKSKLIYLEPPDEDCIFYDMVYPPQTCLRQNRSVSAIWRRAQENLLAVYSLDSPLDTLHPTAVQPWPLDEHMLARYEYKNLHFVLLNFGQNRWRILDAHGNSPLDKQIVAYACTDEQIILLLAEPEGLLFCAYDPATFQVQWSCPLKQTLPKPPANPIMKLLSKERLFFYSKGLYLLLDIPSKTIVKFYKAHEQSEYFSHPNFDGEKIIDWIHGTCHLLDFTYRQEAPRKRLEVRCATTFQRALEPEAPGEPYALTPAPPIDFARPKAATLFLRRLALTLVCLAIASFAMRLFKRDVDDLATSFSSLRL